MKCTGCGRVGFEKTARFCSQCGHQLSTQPLTKETDNTSGSSPKPLQPSLESMTEKTETESDGSSLNNRETNTSPKRPNEEPNSNPKKKRKKRKRTKKKKDGPGSLDSDQVTSDMSDISLMDSQGKNRKQEVAESSDSDSDASAMDETSNSLHDTSASVEKPASASASSAAPSTISPTGNTSDNQGPPSTASSQPEAGAESQPAAGKDKQSSEENDISQSPTKQTSESAPNDTPASLTDSAGKFTTTIPPLQSASAVAAKTTDQKAPKAAEAKSTKNKKNVANSKQTNLDQNANQNAKQNQTRQDKQEGKDDQQDHDSKPPTTGNKDMVFGSHKKSEVESRGSSVDPEVKVENMEVQQQPAHGGGDASTSSSPTPQSPGVKKEKQKDNKSDDSETKGQDVPPPKRIPQGKKQVSASERLTIYFHAVLSKDFKLNPDEDRIFIRAGGNIGTWDKDSVELTVSRNLGEHGFLVEGSLITSKSNATVSIPYKYLVYKHKKQKYEYEYIYKLDSTHPTTNRCLFVKSHLLNEEGDWHQYDDIICVEPSKNMLKRLKDVLWPEQRKSVIEGREIAGKVMLESIFDLLRSWTDINLKSFLNQLNQFYQIYGNPFVYEETHKKWFSLDYDEKDVRKLLKQFMLDSVVPQLQKEGEGKSCFIQDPMRAAVVMLYVWKQYGLKLDHGESTRLCTALCLPKLPKDSFLQYWTDFSQAVSGLKNLPDMLVALINSVKTEGPRWILVLPLLHLLKGSSKPFAPISTTVTPKYEQSWAGLQGLKAGNMTLNSQDRRAMLNLMKNNGHLVEMDRLVSRSWMCLLPIEDLMECSVLINVELLDLLHVFTLRAPQDVTYSNNQYVSDTLSYIQSNLIEEKYSCFSEAYGRECLSTAVKLLEKICRGVRSTSTYTQNFTDIPVACMNMVVSVSEFARTFESQATKDVEREHMHAKELELLSEAMVIVRSWIGQTFRDRLLGRGASTLYLSVHVTTEIEMWNNIISLKFANDDFTKEWRQTFTRDLEGKLKRESPLDQIEIYCSQMEVLNESHPHVARSIEKCALEAVTSLCQSKSEGKLFDRFRINWKFGKLISAIIQKSWPRNERGDYHEEDEVVFQHLLSWTAAKNIFQLHGADEKLIDQLSEEARERMAVAISSFTAISNQLVHGNIRIKLLNSVLEKRDTFTELLKIDCLSENERYKDSAPMKRLLLCRQEEVNAVYHEKELVEVLLTMSRKLQEHVIVDFEGLEERLQTNIEAMTLDQFMEVHPFDQLSSPMAGVVTFFELDDDMREMAGVLHTFKDSYIFKLCWEKQAQDLARRDRYDEDHEEPAESVDYFVGPVEIHSDIFLPCYAKYVEIYKCLKNGSLLLEEVDTLFKAYRGKYEELAQDLDIMCRNDKSDNKQWIQRRVQQIEQYHELHLAVESAQVIMLVKQTLNLQGNFQVLQTLLEVTHEDFKREHLDRIDNDLMQTKLVLVDITEPRRLCLQELGLRKNFVIWVKEALEDINELKVFVDLASISAGENDLDVDRVACFHDAVLGYSPMLYELKPDSGFQAFKEVLKKLWRALDNDNNLPKKLRDTARHLEWLKTVKDSHGSVELSSLSLASAINSKGIYIISAPNQKKLSLDTALKLQIPEEHDEGHEMRRYSLEDLRELQNKLMLMSGKGDQGQCEVDQFAEVFASVQRLAVAFIALFTAGNPLFRHWEANINCSSLSQDAGIIMDFNLGSIVSVIMVEGSIVEQLPELCRKMEKCLKYWNDFMDKQRSHNYYLNYYTAEQIVYLCSKLTQQNVSNLEDQVLMMLSFVKPNCTASDLRQTWHTLQYEILTNPPEQNEDIDFQTFVEVPSSAQGGPDFIREFNLSSDDLPSLVEHISGSGKLDLMWNAYMRDMKSFLPDTLDVRSFGRLLEILANIGDENEGDMTDENKDQSIERLMPKGLAIGSPNLIVSPHDEILTACISIYMSSKHEPLPTYDEVLLCSSSMPYEQVELFLRRCLTAGYRGQKIYTMLYGDQLSYDVSSKVESFFQRIKMQSRKDYRLVIICSSDREHAAYLPSAFSQYRLHMVPQEPLSGIQRYLNKHYTVPSDQSSAAAVFKDRLFVGVVSSSRAGVGKSLYINRLYEKLKHSTKKPSLLKCIRLIEPRVDENVILQSLLNTPKSKELTIFHFDVTSSVQKGLYEFLFKLLVLGYLMDSEGRMWKCSNKQLYVIEILQSTGNLPRNGPRTNASANSTFLDVFPNVFCRPPKEVLDLEMRMLEDPSFVKLEDPLMDDQEFRSEAYQRPYQYLTRFHNHIDLDTFMYNGVEGTYVECLQMLFMFCGIMDPSWAELRNFAWFLNLQLQDCETSVFCDASFTGDTLQGFKNFVVDFMILMAKDFATPSLSISDQSPGRQQMDLTGVSDEDLAPFRIRKRWESEPHPYIFFNDDHVSMTFIGFHLQPNEQNSVDAIDPSTRRVIKRDIMTRELYEGLKLQRVPFNIDFDQLPRGEKIERLCNVLGIQWPLDPDETYELTTDNILKMLAIHMRFRCGIPVIIMGETGCGKTRLIKFLCELRRSGVATENMKLVKVHGGTSSDMIYTKVREAEAIAFTNKQDYGFDSVLFFDEANTTEAISSIKEVLCDNTVKGECLVPRCGLQIIAACNPYRKHTDEMIQRLESAGLGYRVRAEETDEKLGSIPLRQLVYRVQALPPSMIPLVWDFGQLNDHTEKIYIQQIVQRVVETNTIDIVYTRLIADVLSASQRYMRTRKDECSFVSLRDVERCMQAFVWFYKNHAMLLAELNQYQRNQNAERNKREPEARDPVLWSVVMALGVCYHACLENKDKYRQRICKYLTETYTPFKVMQEISLMQDLLLSGVPLGETIARNNALKENVFMMVVCIELRIPLFLVGKPGSSKSLSKTLVADAMQGQAAHSDLYKRLKQIHLVSFQCSPHSTPEGIINTFKQCGRFQEGKNLKEYISVVVLDEIGLAEDSPKMPLKTLHPLLEEGCIDDEPLPHKKVGFIGISNWALDPAKMNRGIFVSRGDPDEKELIESAKGICSSDTMILEKVRDFFQPFARAYLNICRKQGKGFFGLRDYYSLIKMIFAVTKASEQRPSAEKIVEAVLRNFSGREDVDAVTVFTKRLQKIQINLNLESISTIDLVRQNISAIGQEEECRYLLVLTKNYAALQILQQTFFSESCQPEIIFGSSFPKDQEYTQICRNINRVKICMETGRTVVLLNLQNLYESLYDALNQYYVCLGGQKYVDLGLGTHRVKCRVHKDFRLIVVEEKEVVYKQFPIPLINRLEKHYLDIHTVLKEEQRAVVVELEKWVGQFVALNNQHSMAPQTYKYLPPDVFIGFHSDTCASVVLQMTEKQRGETDISDPQRRVLDEAKLILLNCATPDSVVRLDCTGLPRVESEHLARVYFEDQKHSSLADFIFSHTQQDEQCHSSFTEVTTFSRLLTASDVGPLEEVVHNVELLSLQQFDTEHSFLKKIRHFLKSGNGRENTSGNKILIIQSDFDEASHSANLIASAKYSAINEINKSRQEEMGGKVFVYFITKLPRMEGGTSYVGFHGDPWRSVHIDDLRRSKDIVSDIKALRNLTISQLFEEKKDEPEAMEVDDMYTETEQQELEHKDQTSWGRVVDTTALVRSCVQNAVGMLRDQLEGGVRSTRRVEILLTLLTDNQEIRAEFLRTVKRRLHSLLSTHDDNKLKLSSNNWVIKEASNIDALQEGGTFRHTLWKRVQAVVIPFLAQLVSVIDRDRNLDILLDSNSGEAVKKLWLDIFGNDKLLEVPYTRLDRNSESKTILVQNYIGLDKNIGCMMPFSWRIRDYLDELWVHALQREGHTQSQFEEFFRKTPLGRYITKAEPEMQAEFFHRYLQDFISMTMNVTCQDDLQLLCGALTCCVNELRLRHDDVMEKEVTSLPWVHAAYHEFKNRLQNLFRMISIEPQLAQVLRGNTHAREGDELVLDVYAAVACVEYLEPQALDTDGQRLVWLRQVKRLQVPIELVCSEESLRHYEERSMVMVHRVQTGWNRIFTLSLFVEHMLLGIEAVEKKLKPLVLEHTRGLCKVLEKNSDLKSEKPFEAVIGILKACKDGAMECIFRFGLQPCPVCMGDPHDPLSLPCDHIYCLACIRQWLVPGQMYCPLCMQAVPDDFALRPSEDIRVLINQNARFRKQCNAFFIDLVSTVCFKDNSPPCRAIILHLLSFLMVHSVPIIRGGHRQILTKALSPFDDSVDKNPVVRSVVLKLLLKYSFDDVKGYLQQHLTAVEQSNILEESDKTELYSLYINCLEDSMFERMQCHTAAEQQACLQDESVFLGDFLQLDAGHAATVEYLQQVARVRIGLDRAADLLVHMLSAAAATGSQEESPNGVAAFLTSVVDLCIRSGNDWYRVYLIRKICSQCGVEFVQKLLKVADVRWLFPAEVLQHNEDGSQIDQYLVCGEDYKTIRDAVAKAMMEGKIEGLDKACEGCKCPPQKKAVYLLLALFREVTSLYRSANDSFHPKPVQCQGLLAFIQASRVLVSPEVRAFAQALVANRLGPLEVRPGASGAQCVVVELSVHLAAVLLCGNQGLLTPLQQLALLPANMQRAFLPTMPEDMLAVAHKAMGQLQWYFCPNNHPCTIGECGQPMERSRCLDCGLEIGGDNHKAVPGFQAFQIQGDRTQTGHILGDPRRRDNLDMQDTKNMSPVPFNLLRLITHMAMLLGASSHPQVIGAIIKPPVPDPGTFLWDHLLKDMEQVTRSLGKGSDDTVNTVHLVISSLLEPHQPGPVPYDNLLSTKEARNGWETTVSNDIITPQLKHLDRRLKEVNAFVRADSRVSSNPVMRLVFGDPRLFLTSLPRGSLIHSSAVWSCRERVSLLSLTHIVEQHDGKDTLPMLWRFLQREAELRLVKFLPDILALQRDLVKMFQNVTDLNCGTIAEFLHSQKAASLSAWYEKRIKIFLTTWNQLRVSLATNGEIKIPGEFCQEDLDLTSDFLVLLPRRQGPGLCSTALVSYLIALHNELVYCVDKHTGEETSYTVSPADLSDLHVIRYEPERDLLPLVLSNCQYSVERGQEALHEYDLPKIQQQILARFLQGKPLVTLNGIPTLVNRHDRNYENILKDVKGKVQQEPLPILTLSALAGELQSYSEVCEALSTVEVALGFLAMTGGEPLLQLERYLEEVLQMGDQTSPHILKALSRCSLKHCVVLMQALSRCSLKHCVVLMQALSRCSLKHCVVLMQALSRCSLKHCVALWQLLTSLKSENMLRLKRDPFVGVSEKYRNPLGDEERRLLTTFFTKSSADSFLLEMHEFLLLVLKNPRALDTYRPDWGLKDTLLSYMERKDLDVPHDVDELFPGEISLAQYIEAWKFTVAFKQERSQR
ncbi:E3 ubiquitin-protein ligase rnf213-alpha-like isoform X2 [Coregonus clupeaformis]|uniref:E3 ubiquitin-protein ligase rnf213-alpha-like isoform X2 n=1 Tax=Coregonus clupeaformis TaxID=59861 RepID=UPI001E1C2A94|nr:E3 ubiquitin-protein ligase rnf213-alpha-like isoform X2 [Coregonus clupeaformis]